PHSPRRGRLKRHDNQAENKGYERGTRTQPLTINSQKLNSLRSGQSGSQKGTGKIRNLHKRKNYGIEDFRKGAARTLKSLEANRI
ncbi:hypothetical protein, partial [Akkermansia massiliensis]|uniref:hypothetical protein n=1 Tax=Akkermansia massiliensis TaxID=2927224 RepID=UPI003F7C7A86